MEAELKGELYSVKVDIYEWVIENIEKGQIKFSVQDIISGIRMLLDVAADAMKKQGCGGRIFLLRRRVPVKLIEIGGPGSAYEEYGQYSPESEVIEIFSRFILSTSDSITEFLDGIVCEICTALNDEISPRVARDFAKEVDKILESIQSCDQH